MAATYLAGLNAPPAASAATGCGHGFSVSGSSRPSRATPVTCQASRRSASLHLGLAAATAVLLRQPDAARAAADGDEPANNGWWLTEFPLPVPKILNREINNPETGTRSFLKNGIFMADIGPSFAAHAYRLRSTAFDLLALEDLLGKEASNYVNKYLRLKSTFMYYDFDKLITAADDKAPFVDLANRLFDSFETLQQAVTAKDDTKISERYAETKVILQELMAKMA
ncbi:photosynthetic NDH subunit of lumenal location 3, chloroplastic [Panicum miliaceum]|uniref:Photosynthetic NDH subunit of lumenal location 3, chloroplastic n=1 Tax=Panicum miliaceum TaxID=4540 RepID=A0A3L6TE75_PANMI|nr:photosynthetic NDH subunit of lumenal location 3, chloroplastic [Panicum miliaceum]